MTKRNILITIAVVIFLFILLGSGSEPVEEEATAQATPTVTTAPTVEPTEKVSIAEKTFIEGCTEDGQATLAYCQCMYKELRKDYTLSEIVELYGDITEQEAMELMLPYVIKCIDYMEVGE